MPIIERVLLYVVALSLGVMLLWSDDNDASRTPPQSEMEPQWSTRISDAAPFDERASVPRSIDTAATADMPANQQSAILVGEFRDRLVLVDEQGRPRIELRVGIGGHPQIHLRNEKGEPVISLTAGPNDSAEMLLQTRYGSAGMHRRADGELAVELTSYHGARTGMAIDSAGEISITADAGPGKSKAFVRTDADGGAEVTVEHTDGARKTAMWMLPSGDSGVTLQAGPDQPGPAMRLFQDGLAEVTINGPGSESGPSMVRFPDGVSIISARRPNGEPGASMIVSPDGTCVVTAASPDGTQRAELRVNAEGKADVSVTKPDSPSRTAPKPKMEPQPRPVGAARNAILGFGTDDQE